MSKPPVTQAPGRKKQVEAMFNSIAGKYDLLNHLLSFGVDRGWRNTLIKKMGMKNPKHILDLATGTADLAIAASKLNPELITATDISEKMLEIGRQKVKNAGLEQLIHLQIADSENLPFDCNTFDAAMVAFGVRNYENLEKGLSEMCRVLKTGSSAYILEFSSPETFPMKQFYAFYSVVILPFIGKMISNHPTAYSYLPESVKAFPRNTGFTSIMLKAGFSKAEYLKMSFGITNLYIGVK